MKPLLDWVCKSQKWVENAKQTQLKPIIWYTSWYFSRGGGKKNLIAIADQCEFFSKFRAISARNVRKSLRNCCTIFVKKVLIGNPWINSSHNFSLHFIHIHQCIWSYNPTNWTVIQYILGYWVNKTIIRHKIATKTF